jgi:hypothetical protein
MQSRFPLGTVIAERRIQLYEQTGEERWITVRLGSPVGVHLEDGSPLRSGIWRKVALGARSKSWGLITMKVCTRHSERIHSSLCNSPSSHRRP